MYNILILLVNMLSLDQQRPYICEYVFNLIFFLNKRHPLIHSPVIPPHTLTSYTPSYTHQLYPLIHSPEIPPHTLTRDTPSYTHQLYPLIHSPVIQSKCTFRSAFYNMHRFRISLIGKIIFGCIFNGK